MDSDNIDLSEVQQKVNETRDYFLHQNKRYENKTRNTEKIIVEKYLRKFCDDHPDRAELVKDAARKTISKIEMFESERVSLMFRVGEGGIAVQLIVGALTIHAHSKQLDVINDIAEDVQDLLLRKNSSKQDGKRVNMDAVLKQGLEDASAFGYAIASTQQLAGDVLRNRCEAIDSIEKGYLTTSLKEAVDAALKHLADTPKDEVLGEAIDMLSTILKDIGEVMLDEDLPHAPFKRIIEAFHRSLSKIMKVGGAEIKPDDASNKMMKIFDLLGDQDLHLEKLNKAYERMLKLKDEILERTNK